MSDTVQRAAAAGYGVLTTTGRRTGKPRRKCVRVIHRGDRAYLVALRLPDIAIVNPDAVQAWVLNIRTDPHVRLRIRGGDIDGVAREITDADERALHLRGLPTRNKIRELHRYWFETGIPIAIDLKETAL
jgi:deazaflavin-dependent oxidoreductase (nitroreductase family)